MNWKQDLEALIESTMAFAKDVRAQSLPDRPTAAIAAKQALADNRKPVIPAAAFPPIASPRSERDEIRQRVSDFRMHQEKVTREREGYYLQIKARMMASVDANHVPLRPE
jgi:hypothetical protein